MDSARDFLDRAIEESQLTIRAIDVKVGALIAAILSPLAAISRVFAHLENFYQLWPHWPLFLINVVFMLMWLLALASLVNAIAAIDNPALHIPNVKMFRGTFYGGGLFELSFVDALINRREVIAKRNPTDFQADLPKTFDEIQAELAFEQMKLAYIRDIKLNRLKWGLRFARAWLLMGIAIFLASRYLHGKSFW